MFKVIKKKAIQIGLGIFCLCLVLVLQTNHLAWLNSLLSQVDGILYDHFTVWNMHEKAQSSKVIVIDIDDTSVQSVGRWPWPRDKFVTMLDNLKKAGVVVVAFDIVMSEAEKNYALSLRDKLTEIPLTPKPLKEQITPQFIALLDELAPKVDNDEAFANALRDDDVVLGFLFHDDPAIKKGVLPQALRGENGQLIDAQYLPIPEFKGYNGSLELFRNAAPRGGFVSNSPDLDGVLRHGFMLASHDNKVYASIALSTVMHYLMADKITLLPQIRSKKQKLTGIGVGGISIPVNSQGEILVPYWGLPSTIDTYSASDILNNKIPAQALAGSIAIIGSTMVLLHDRHESPVSLDFPGVEMVANMVSAILSKQVTVEYDWDTWTGITVMSAFGIFLAILLPFLGPVLLLLIYLISVFTVILGSFLLLSLNDIYVSSVFILFLITLQNIINFSYNFILERKQKNKIKDLFSQYVPPTYVKELTESPEQYSLDGEIREMSVFFADIRGFTTLSESLDAGEVKRLLNTFFTPLTNIIFNHQGTIDKYVGDMIMAFWGAPLADQEHARHAFEAAMDIRNQLAEINKNLASDNLPKVKIGMGLSAGLMNVGDMGSSFRRSYTVIGDTVNLAARLQDLTKFYQVDILVTESMRANQDSIFWYPVDKVAVKGRHNAVMIYTPVIRYQDASIEMRSRLHDYELALASYFGKNWIQARSQFEALVSTDPSNYLYQLYLARVEEFYASPPPEDWDGTFIHTHK